ncbi:DMT family transporter [Pseudodonghicola flavimaris]|uniref:DMT family transporter n=1 Tax=Pseudodonghicola flavimaris TaxID=3050036 RepID=A0ABT7EVH1_9RHOB|nr:DMT family transporter [Pseudodonghicola flavimaris]MDK3016337.1 DMT family transporter [Pseudodonghicola flavimaris]
MSAARRAALAGAGLTALYTGLIAGADGITKLVAGGYAAPQMFAISGALVIALSVLADRHPSQGKGLRTRRPGAMALRSAATVVAAVAFFQAFRLLPFTDVFLFIALMPILAALMSGPILGEYVRPAAWVALAAGVAGVVCLFPEGLHGVGSGHLWAGLAAVSGTFSMLMARLIGRTEQNALAQVFYPNLALCLTMSAALPFVWRPMSLADLGWIAAYAGLLFAARWVSVVALRLLAAYAVTPLMNLQFIWMVAIGALAFGELPTLSTVLGAVIVVGSGLYLVWDQIAPQERLSPDLRTDP